MKILLSATALAATAALSLPAAAETFTFGSLYDGAGAPERLSFATMTATTVGDDVHFVLDAWGLDQFASDLAIGAFIGSIEVDGTRIGSVGDVTGGADVVMARRSGIGWAFRFDLSETGISRLVDDEVVSWTWFGGAGYYDDFAARVRGLDTAVYGVDHAFYTTAVPEPATYALFAGGLAVVGAVARRRQRKG